MATTRKTAAGRPRPSDTKAGPRRRRAGSGPSFDKLLLEISSRLINLPSENVDSEILATQRKVCEWMDLDASVLWQRPPGETDSMIATHLYLAPGYPVPVPDKMDGAELFPWSLKTTAEGKIIAAARLADYPAAAARDRETLRRFGVTSGLTIPLSAGGGLAFGALHFFLCREERAWSNDVVERLKLVGQIFSNALARKQADLALRESEARYRSLFRESPIGIYRISLSGKFHAANPALARILGYASPQELMTSVPDVGTAIWLSPGDRARFIRKLDEKGGIQGFESEFKRRDGTKAWFSLTVRLVRGPDGKPEYSDGFVEDIGSRRLAQEALKESEARYRSLFEESPIGIFRVTREGQIAAVNPAVARMAGYDSPEDFITSVKSVRTGAWLNEENRASYFRELDEKGEVRAVERQFWRKDWTTTWFSITARATRGPDGKTVYADGFLQDINERKKAEEALQSSRRLLHEVEGIGRIGGAEIDVVTGKRTWTAGLFDIFEVAPGFELTMETISRFFTPTSRDLYKRAIDRAIQSGEPLDLEAEIVTGLGHPRNLHIIGRVDPENRKIYVIYQDVTEQLKSERERLELRTERTHLSRVLSVNEVSSSLAHEINQPLGAILNNAEALKTLLSRPKSEQKEFPEIVEDIIQDAQRAGNVVRKIRGIVKRPAVSSSEALSVNGLIDDVLSFLHNNLVLNDIELRLQLAPELPGIRGDRVRLQQVLLNLMTNALDAMRGVDARALTVRSAKDGPNSIVVSISDSGPGIDKGDREKLFDPFFTTKKDGLGLGLSICRSIIEEHGGRIWAEDRPGGGAVFSFSLKIDPAGAE